MISEGINGYNPYKDIKSTVCAIDYDGTLVDDNEEFVEEALAALKKLNTLNITIILWSCRTNDYLEKVKDRLNDIGVRVDLINENCSSIKEKPEEEEIEDTSNLVELENMDSVIQEAIEKNIK